MDIADTGQIFRHSLQPVQSSECTTGTPTPDGVMVILMAEDSQISAQVWQVIPVFAIQSLPISTHCS